MENETKKINTKEMKNLIIGIFIIIIFIAIIFFILKFIWNAIKTYPTITVSTFHSFL